MFGFLFWIWLAVAIGFAVAEIMAFTFYMLPFSLGGIVALIANLMGASAVVQTVLFVVVSLVALALLRPFARRVTRKSPRQTSGIDRLDGEVGVLTQSIKAPGGMGRMTVNGEDWLCAAVDHEQSLETGRRVRIDHIDGTKAMVVPE